MSIGNFIFIVHHLCRPEGLDLEKFILRSCKLFERLPAGRQSFILALLGHPARKIITGIGDIWHTRRVEVELKSGPMSETNHHDVQLFAVTANGPMPLPVPPAARSFDDLYEGLVLGVYSALRTFEHHQFLYLAAHIERTRQSMALLGWDYQLDEAALRRALHTVCSAYHRAEARVRFDVLAEPAWALGTDSRLLIALMPFTPPSPDMVANGVRVDLALDLERKRPLAKTADFAVARRRYLVGQAEGVYEYLLVNEQGYIWKAQAQTFTACEMGPSTPPGKAFWKALRAGLCWVCCRS